MPTAPLPARVYTFGDSLVDDGGTVGTFPLAAQFGAEPFPVSPPYAAGRYSNGPIYDEYLARSLGAPSALDRNFAIAGATARLVDDPADPRQTLGNFDGQVTLFEQSFGRLDPDDLVLVNFGGNDLPLVVRAASEGGPSVEEGVARTVEAILGGLERLAAAGGARFVVNTLPQIELTPFIAADPEAFEARFRVDLETLNAVNAAFNDALLAALAAFETRTGASVTAFDLAGFVAEVTADPAAFGIENLAEPVLATRSGDPEPRFNPAIDGATPEVADATFFFDQEFHLTTAVHRQIAERLRARLTDDGVVARADFVEGGPQSEGLRGGPGPQVMAGGAGADTIFAGPGADALLGEAGADRLFGGAGADRLIGGAGDDLLLGGRGADRLDGGPGADLLLGGAGPDVIVFGADAGDHAVLGFRPGEDRLDLRDRPGVSGLADLVLEQVGLGTSVSDGGAGSLRLLGIAPWDLSADDFVFA